MEYRVLGPLQVLDSGVALELGNPQQRALLALLLINANRVVSTDRVLDELWGDEAHGKENAMWVYISRLRSALEPGRLDRGDSSVLLTRDHGYVLTVDPESIDSHRFEIAAAEGRSLIIDDPERASSLLADALTMWRGDAYQDCAYEQFAQIEIARLEALRVTAVHDRIEADLRRGLSGELIGELEALQQVQHLQERPVAQLMLALYRTGRQADALRTFERFRRHIGEELGIEPSPELRRLEEQVLLHDALLRPLRVAASAAGRRVPVSENPFKGLRAFREDDGAVFFGRDRLVADLVRRLEAGDRMLCLVGPSGSGKSSVVKAGLIPAIRKGALTGSDRWLVAQMVPGAHPFAELEAGLLRSTVDAPDSLTEQLSDPDGGLMRAALRVLPDEDSRLVLVVDQLEELFTLVDRDAERERFLNALLPPLDDPHGRVILVLALRADFYDRPLAYPSFGARLGDAVVNVVPLGADELEEAALKPAERAGVAVESAVLAALLTDVVGQSGALPAFQYALTELFDRRAGNRLTLDAYREMDGVRGALTRRAEELFADLDEKEQVAARQLFLRLVTITEGGEWGRRRVPASEVVSLPVDIVALQGVIDVYTRHRLLTLDRDAVTGSPTIEVAHEALLTEWDRLRTWIDESREDVRRHAALTAAMSEWMEADRDADYLLAGSRLEVYERWAQSTSMSLTADQRSFVDASIEHREHSERAEAERTAHERLTERSARRLLWGLAAAIVVLAAVGAIVLLAALAPDPPRIVLVGIERDGTAISEQILNGFEQAGRDLNFRSETFVPKSDPRAEFIDLLESGPDLVLFNPIDLGLSIKDPDRLIAAYPDVSFVDLQGDLFPQGNLSVVGYRTHEGSFLVGVAAARSSATGVIGFIGGTPPKVDPFRAGFEAGARYADPNIEILSRYLVGHGTEVFADREQVEQSSRDLFAQGADVVYHAAGEAGRAIFDVADDMSDDSIRRWGIGVDVDEILLVDAALREHVLTSMLKRHDIAVRLVIERYLDGPLKAAEIELNLANGGLGYSVTGGSLDAETVSMLEATSEQIISGQIVVPDEVQGPATSPAPADAVATLTYDGQRCELDGLDDPQLGRVVRIDVENRSAGEAGFAVWRFRDGTTMEKLLASDPGDLSEPPNLYDTAVFASSGHTHAMTVDLNMPGVWGVGCNAFDTGQTYWPAFFDLADG